MIELVLISLLQKADLWRNNQRSSFQLIFEFWPAKWKKFLIPPTRSLAVKHVRFVDDSRGLREVWSQRVSQLDKSFAVMAEVTGAYR